MKIVDVKTHVISTPWRNLTFVRVITDEGIEGVGEVRMLNHTDAFLGLLKELVPNHVIGRDPFDIESLVYRLYRDDYQRPGQIQMSATAAIEVACWDIMGKALNQPVYRLLGGKVRDRIKAYANGWYKVERTSEEFYTAAKAVTARGYRALKFDPFGAGFLELDYREKGRAIELVAAVRDAVGPETEILIEMHGRMNRTTALEMADALVPYKPSWIEEPVPPENLETLRDVTMRTTIPVATGERLYSRHEFRRLFELQAADIIQPDIMHTGGLMEMKKIAGWAEAYYILVAPHNVGGPVATAAALHFAASTTNFKIQEHFNDFADSDVKALAPGNPEVIDGYFALPEGPGLGIELDIEALEARPRQESVVFNLYEDNWHLRQNSQG